MKKRILLTATLFVACCAFAKSEAKAPADETKSNVEPSTSVQYRERGPLVVGGSDSEKMSKPWLDVGRRVIPNEENSLPTLSLRTNVLYLGIGVLNIGAEWFVCNGWSVKVEGGGSDWKWNHNMRRHRTWYVNPEVRKYLGTQNRWYAGLGANIGQYNLKLKDTGRQGDMWNVGVVGGYRLPLSSKFAVDFSLGLGYSELDYDKYNTNCCPVQYIRTTKDKKKEVWGPTQVSVAFIWDIF